MANSVLKTFKREEKLAFLCEVSVYLAQKEKKEALFISFRENAHSLSFSILGFNLFFISIHHA